jgi:putative membrane-bound dehydrogenase-like protein
MQPLIAVSAFLVLMGVGQVRPFPRAKPLEPAEAVRAFRVQGGFRVELQAAEPMVTSPVAAAYDEDGRLYVAEMIDYPNEVATDERQNAENVGGPPIGRVMLLIDRNDDGVFDESHIFADKLSWPTGVVVSNGGVFVTATPDIWYLKDTDGDHRADQRRRAFTGFRKLNDQGVINNLQPALDHWIYGAGSSNGGLIRPTDRQDVPGVDILRRDFRFHPNTGVFEAISGGARFGNTSDDFGNRFLCDIRNPAQHVVLPARYLARNPYLPMPRPIFDVAEFGDTIRLFRISPAEPWREFRARRWAAQRQAMPRSELVGAGFLTSSTGLTVYRGDAFPPAYYGNLFLGEVANNLVHRMRLEPDGVTFKAVRADPKAEFIASVDTWYRPVNFVNGPDGALTMLDMYRETIEDPSSIPDDINAHLDFRAGADRGRVYRIAPPGFQHRPTPRLSAAPTAELVKLLEHPNGWHRETAHRLIYERQDQTAVPLLKPLVREAKEPRARVMALYSLEGLGALDEESLLAALADSAPPVREHAVLLAEPGLVRSPALKAMVARMADDPNIRVRFQVAFTLGGVGGDEALKGLAAIARHDASDLWVRTAVLSSAAADPAGLFDRIWQDRDFTASADRSAILRPLAVVVAVKNRPGEAAHILTEAAGGIPGDPQAGHTVILGLGDGLARASRRLSDLKAELTPTAAAWLDRQFAEADALATDVSRTVDRRVEAVALVGYGPYERAAAIVPGLLAPHQPPELQRAAARLIAGYDRPEVPNLLFQQWKSFSPGMRTEVVALLAGRRSWIKPVLDAVGNGLVYPAEIQTNRRAQLMRDRDPAIRERAQALLGALAPGPRAPVIDKYKPAIEHAGDAERGRVVFERECKACHKVGERGFAVGPNLGSTMRKTPEEILVSVLDPNREAPPEFQEYTVALDDGRVVSGLVASETPASFVLRGREGVEQTILRRNVAEISATGKSLMPEGLEKTISPAEMHDLITFVLSIHD